jgi:hypothetical protein
MSNNAERPLRAQKMGPLMGAPQISAIFTGLSSIPIVLKEENLKISTTTFSFEKPQTLGKRLKKKKHKHKHTEVDVTYML